MASSNSDGPSSRGSYSDVDMRLQAEWQAEVMQLLKKSELDELLNAKGHRPKGLKPQRAKDVAWLYTKEEVVAYREKKQAMGPPALMAGRDDGSQASGPVERTLNDFW